MPRLKRIIGKIESKDDSPKIVGLDANSSYSPGYRPESGTILTDLMLMEDGGFLLFEDESFILNH